MKPELVSLARKCLDGITPHEAVNPFVRELTAKTNTHLLHAAALFVLQAVADQKGTGQPHDVTHERLAGAGASGQRSSETHAASAGSATPSPKPKRKWTPPPKPTPEQRAGAAQVAKLVALSAFETYKIGRRPFGDFKYRELGALISQSAAQAAGKLNGGLKQATDGVLAFLSRNYAQPTSDDMRMCDIIPKDKQERMVREADALAREIIARGVKGQAAIIRNPLELLSTPAA